VTVAVAAALGMCGTARASGARPGGLAPTLSGLPSAPRRERSLPVRHAGVGIVFRAPTDGDIQAVHSFWRGRTAGCTVVLAEDEGGTPGRTLASAPLADVPGWTEATLRASLTAGDPYHLVFRCAGRSHARLGYIIDADRSAERSGAWRLERLRARGVPRHHHGSPLFAFAFSDGRWWGQPYRAVRGRPLVRVCSPSEASATLVASRPLLVSDVRLPARARRAGVRFALDTSDGTTVLASGTLPAGPVRLDAGVSYTLRLGRRARGRCFRERALVTDLPVGPSLAGLEMTTLRVSGDDGRRWRALDGRTLSLRLIGTDAPLASCGDGVLATDEQCDGAADGACPGRCSGTCTCRPAVAPPPTCGDGNRDPGEECDGAADAACPGRCTASCTCGAAPPRRYRSIYASGYLGLYDRRTIPVWPKRLGLMLGEASAQGPLVAPARALAAASGNGDARFIFYLSLTDMDSRCACFDQGLYDGFRRAHPDWILRDAGGALVSTSNGVGRLFATDIGNLAYVDAWADYALAAADRWGWDGTFVDNVFRGYFGGWSATPVNPRSGRRYTTAEYRADVLAAVRRLRQRFEARGKILIGNHTSAWDPATFADPLTREEVLALGGVEIEDCVYDWAGNPHTENEWIAQVQYLDFANRHGVRTVCSSPSAIGHAGARDFVLATYLLTKEGFSSVSELNTLDDWWSGLAVDLGAPLGGYACLAPGAGFTPATPCPAPGNVYVREWERGRVLANPSATATVTVPLETDFLLAGNRVRAVTLGPRAGAVLQRP
jgi:putative glycosyl hydrolase-like family 15 (GHL15) protein